MADSLPCCRCQPVLDGCTVPCQTTSLNSESVGECAFNPLCFTRQLLQPPKYLMIWRWCFFGACIHVLKNFILCPTLSGLRSTLPQLWTQFESRVNVVHEMLGQAVMPVTDWDGQFPPCCRIAISSSPLHGAVLTAARPPSMLVHSDSALCRIPSTLYIPTLPWECFSSTFPSLALPNQNQHIISPFSHLFNKIVLSSHYILDILPITLNQTNLPDLIKLKAS